MIWWQWLVLYSVAAVLLDVAVAVWVMRRYGVPFIEALTWPGALALGLFLMEEQRRERSGSEFRR